MRAPSIPLLLLVLITLSPSPHGRAGSPAPLGRLLANYYPGMGAADTAIIIIYLKDKGDNGRAALLAAADLISPKAIARRSKVRAPGRIVDESDYPVEPSYIGAISGRVSRARHALKWFNAVSAEATKEQIDGLRLLPFVREIDLVGRWRKRPGPEEAAPKVADESDRVSGTAAHLLDYGASLTQNQLIDVPEVHDLGIFGAGVTVGVFDNGFRLLTHQSFDSMNIVAQYDFVDHKVSVVPLNPSPVFGSHGVNTLSTVGGYRPGQLIGPAFRADYILARTENDSSETPVEEDNWAAAIEWADSVGVDVTTTSLTYLDYQVGYTSWTPLDMDGNTTLITRAADHAVSLGIVVLNSAGNGGAGSGMNTLGAPADGDSVIAVGAVGSNGVRASFSSVGPTTDVPPRIKPDVMAMGVSVRVASSTNPAAYTTSSGTSFACPLTAGVAALILSANPTLGPMQVRDALRNTADNASSPDNQYGWGIVDADSAVRHWGILPLAGLSGTIFHDVDGNGTKNAGEAGMEGETVLLSGPTPDTALSGPGGAFGFDSLAIGAYALSTSLAPGWIVTTPPGSLTASLLHRSSANGYSVGLFETGSISGIIFHDADSNGVLNGGEAGLQGWSVRLNGPLSDTVATDSTGAWHFSGLPGGAYTITQDQQPGWLQSFPPAYAAHSVTVTSGLDTSGLAFGDFYAAGAAFPVSAGWNLLSLPVEMMSAVPDSIYPNALSPVSLYDNGYYSADTIPNGKGYWVKFPFAQNIFLQGLDRALDTLPVAAGWNIIGTLSVPVEAGSVSQVPDSLIVSKFYGFSNNAYHAVAPDSLLRPHTGYWVKCSQPGSLILRGITTGR